METPGMKNIELFRNRTSLDPLGHLQGMACGQSNATVTGKGKCPGVAV